MKKVFILILLIFFSSYIFTQELENKYTASQSVINDLFVGKSILFGNIELSNKKINDHALAMLNTDELRLLRNSLYAKYGYIFSSTDLTTYFSQFSWYKPSVKNVDSFLTEIDKYNIESIKVYENKYKNNAFGDSDKVLTKREWYTDIVAAGRQEDNFKFYDNGKISFRNKEISLRILYGYDGVYSIKDGILNIEITEVLFKIPNLDYEENGSNGIDWTSNNLNKIKLEEPIRLRYPISDIEDFDFYGFSKKRIYIGTTLYYNH